MAYLPVTLSYLSLCLTSQSGDAGGWLWQQADNAGPDTVTFTPVSETQPSEQQLKDLAFAWRCVKHVKSNAITVAKEERLLGMGSGQPNRVKSVQIALEKAAQDVEVRPMLQSYRPKAAQVSHMCWLLSNRQLELLIVHLCL